MMIFTQQSTMNPLISTMGTKRRLGDMMLFSNNNNNSNTSNDELLPSAKRQRITKRATFQNAPDQVSSTPSCSDTTTWMSQRELKACKNDIKLTITAFHRNNRDISKVGCLRGLEGVLTSQAHKQSQQRRRNHARQVILAQQMLRSSNNQTIPAHMHECLLERISQESSQETKRVAARRAALDASDFSMLFC